MNTATALTLAAGALIALAATHTHTPAAPTEARPAAEQGAEQGAEQTERTLKTARRLERRLARAAEMIEQHKHGAECKENPPPVAPPSLSR